MQNLYLKTVTLDDVSYVGGNARYGLVVESPQTIVQNVVAIRNQETGILLTGK